MEIWEIGIELIKNMIDMNIININRNRTNRKNDK